LTEDTLTFIPINDKLKALEVTKFAKQSNVIDIGFKEGQMVVFDIDPKKVTNTRDNFEKEARRYHDLSKSTISKVSLVLMDSTNSYLQYLLYNKAADAPNGKGSREHSQITTLSRNPAAVVTMRLVKKYCQDFFIDNLGQPYAAVKIDKHLEVLPIKSSRFKNWLCKVFYDFSAERNKEVCNKDGQSKKIHSVEDVKNEAEREAEVEEAEDTAETQHPALVLYGEKATAKSTLQELIKMLVDPSVIRTLAFSRNIEGMIQKLAHNYICYFDNVSKISESISDILCRAVTGSGFSKRELFTNDDDVIYNFIRCIGFLSLRLCLQVQI
jgi:hypothetical protein